MDYIKSARFFLNRADVRKIFKGFLFATTGAGLAYLSTDVVPSLQSADLNFTGALLVTLFSTLVHTAYRWLSDYGKVV